MRNKYQFQFTLKQLLARKRELNDQCIDGGYIWSKYRPRLANWKQEDSEELLAEYQHLFGHPPMSNGKPIEKQGDAVFLAYAEMLRVIG
jgi:hypothetical protein